MTERGLKQTCNIIAVTLVSLYFDYRSPYAFKIEMLLDNGPQIVICLQVCLDHYSTQFLVFKVVKKMQDGSTLFSNLIYSLERFRELEMDKLLANFLTYSLKSSSGFR